MGTRQDPKRRGWDVRGRKTPADVLKEVVSVAAGVTVFGGAVLADIPIFFAAGMAAVAFGLGYALTPRRKTAAQILVAPEITKEQLETWLARAASAQDHIRAKSMEIQGQAFVERIEALCEVVERILENCSKDPEDIRRARSFPFWLEKIGVYLDKYVEVSSSGRHNPEVRNRLAETEQTVERAISRFEELEKALLENDLRALEAKAGALSMEFGEEAS